MFRTVMPVMFCVALCASTGPAVAAMLEPAPAEAAPPPVRVEADPGDPVLRVRHFAVEVEDGRLVGSVVPGAEAGTLAAVLDLEGAGDPVTLRLEADFARPGALDVEVVLAAGSVTYRVGEGPARVVASTISDCSAFGESATFLAVVEALETIGASADLTLSSPEADQARLAWLSVLLTLAAEAPHLEERCEDARLLPKGFCSSMFEWEDDCLDCCESAFGLARIVGVGICASAGAALCSPSGVGSAACGGIGAALCYAAAEYAKASCRESCSPKPKRPDPGDACGAGGTCKDFCSFGETMVPGACREGDVCCSPGF